MPQDAPGRKHPTSSGACGSRGRGLVRQLYRRTRLPFRGTVSSQKSPKLRTALTLAT